jgi:hypothetical protein
MKFYHFVCGIAIATGFGVTGLLTGRSMAVERRVYDRVVPNPDTKIVALREACTGRYPLTVVRVDNNYADSYHGRAYTLVTVHPKGSTTVVTCRVDGWFESLWSPDDQIVILNGTAV